VSAPGEIPTRLPVPASFGFGEEHELQREAARRLLAERCPMREVRRLAEDPLGHDPALWKEMAGLGWTGLVLPADVGGAGLGALHLALLLEEMGRVLLPSPFLACLLAGLLLDRAGSREQRERWLVPLAAGELVASLAFDEGSGSVGPEAVRASAEPTSGGWVLRGRKAHVPCGASAGLLVAPFGVPGPREEVALFAVPAESPGITVEPEVGVDATRRCARVRFDAVRVGQDARLPGDGAAALRGTLARGFAALAAEMVGGAQAALSMTRDYAIARRQFDRPIGAFQAVKHPLVDALIGIELSRTLAYAAAAAFDHDEPEAPTAARMAKGLASDVYCTTVRKAIQLHGGFGFTWDCDAHYFFKRALWSRATLGDGLHHRRVLATRLLGSPSAAPIA
jgi:alkylation response protein AidB-like acyl-CoA dehydrogenase